MPIRRTKIVCTLGPATESEERIEALIRSGMDVARINFSHGTRAEHETVIQRLRNVADRLHHPIAILQDLQGPKIRTGALAGGGPITLTQGNRFILTTEPVEGTAERVSTTYTALPIDVRPSDRILLSDGALELIVERIDGPDVITTVVRGGVLSEHQGINLPGVLVSAPALTEKDRADLAFGIAQGVDYIALSFVRRPDDIRETKRMIRELLSQPERQGGSTEAQEMIPVVAKLERPEAIEHLDAILETSDGVMVARGDLGVEMSLEQVPMVQKRIISRANALGIPVITATQMLDSMITHAQPTRAEVSDVANAILDGTDAVMLSGETAIGQYPIEAVHMMERIALATEQDVVPVPSTPHPGRVTLSHAVSGAARTLAERASAALIVVFTRSGRSAHLISKERPATTIVAYTPYEDVLRRLRLWWGVVPRKSALAGSTEELIEWVEGRLLEEGLARPHDEVVIMGGMPVAGRARTNFVKLHRIGHPNGDPAQDVPAPR